MNIRPRRRLVAALVTATTMVAALVSITLPAAATEPRDNYSLDFGPGSVAEGYEPVACNTLFATHSSYGFASTTGIDGRDRGGADAARSDFCFSNTMDFSAALPAGDYTVRVIYGDLTSSQSGATITAEGQTVVSRAGASAGQFVDRSFNTRVSDGALSLNFTGSPARINALIITPYEWGSQLMVSDDGSGSIHLQNQQVSLRVNKNNAAITELRSNGGEPLRNLLAGGQGDYLANYVVGGVRKQDTLRSADFAIESQTESRIEVSFTETDPNTLPFELEVHLVLEADSPGFYMYSVYRYPENMPADLQLEQLRYQFSADKDLFRWYSVDGDRSGVAPLQSEIDAGSELQDATYRLQDGTVYSKYQQISDGEGSDSVFGIYGDHVGLSLIQANKDWVSGGPTRQELTTHTGGNPRLLWHETSAHYSSERVTPSYGWEKIYGPFFLYVHEGETATAMYADAQQRLETEKAKWPYAWVTDPLYAASERGTVDGHLTRTDGGSAVDAQVLLTDPADEDWQLAFENYIYSARTTSDGGFSIPAVRPGTYTLRAFTDGVFGEYTKTDVVVTSNGSTHLGELEWTPQTNGRQLWQIGVPDRSAAEFHIAEGSPSRVPGLDPYREWGTWLAYPTEFPDDVDFQIGVDNPAQDWNYFQPTIRTPGTPSTLTVPFDGTPTDWKIRFDADGATQGTATLTFGIASSVFGSLKVDVNGEEVAAWEAVPGPTNDSALYRQSDRGVYRELSVEFDAALLEPTGNVINLRPFAEQPDPSAPWTNAFASVMYDAIQLEVEPPADTWSAATRYAAGESVIYSGKTWTALWSAHAQQPGDPTGPWQEIAATSDDTAVWTPSRVFNAGDSAAHDGKTWTAQWWTRNQVPGTPNGPWTEEAASANAEAPAAWTATTIYNTGDRVTHDGARYEAKWWTRGQTPGDPNGPWSVLG